MPSEAGAPGPGTTRLDADHLDQLTEAWIPVETPLGRGVLIFKNSD